MVNRHFNVLVAGVNHPSLMDKYDSNRMVEKYVAFEYAKAEEYRKKFLEGLEEAAKYNPSAQENIDFIKNEDIDDFYLDLTEEYEYDPETGNAISTKNPDGKFDSYRIAGNFAMPFILKNGKEVYSALKGDIDWEKMNADPTPYETAWDLVVGGKKPKNDYEKNIYENMKNRTAYFGAFGNKSDYVTMSTAFWCYAFVSDKNGWTEFGHSDNQVEWVKNFYKKFVKNLPDSTLLTLYECTREP